MQNVLLIFAISLDAFTAAMTYGAKEVKIPPHSRSVIAAISTGFFCAALLFSGILHSYLPPAVCHYGGSLLLCLLGISALFQNTLKRFAKRKMEQVVNLRIAGVQFFIRVCLDETDADRDHSKVLSAREAIYLGAALSMDALMSGIAAGRPTRHLIAILAVCFLVHFIVLTFGERLGARLREKIDLSWLGGIILILLAILSWIA